MLGGEGECQHGAVSGGMAVRAEELQVRQLVPAALALRRAVMDLQGLCRAATRTTLAVTLD